MNDKIREEFEKELRHSYDGGSNQFIVFQAGYFSCQKIVYEEIEKYKSRDAKIKQTLKIIYDSIIAKDWIAAEELLSELLGDGE